MLNPDIQSKVHLLWDRFISEGITNPLTAIEQIGYLLYIKWLDEDDKENTSKDHISIYKGADDELRWGVFSRLGPKPMLETVANQVFPFIKGLNRLRFPLTIHLIDAVCLISRPSILAEAVNIIDEIYRELRNQKTGDTQQPDSPGDVYEYLVNEIPIGSNTGQFRTPRHIVRMMVELVDPGLEDKICDPACGSGGFLVEACRYILAKFSGVKNLMPADKDGFRNVDNNKVKKPPQWEDSFLDPFFGFDTEITMARSCVINLALHGISRPQVAVQDSLSTSFDLDTGSETYSVIFCNPPFGGKSDKEKSGRLRLTSRKTELLFIDRIVQMLQISGQAAVITTDSALSDTSTENQSMRKLLLQNCELKAVINLPEKVFSPYANIQTAILLFKKMDNSDPGGADAFLTEKVWFYDMYVDGDGYSMDDRRQQLDNRPLPGIIKDYKEYVAGNKKSEDRTQKHFFVPVADIVANDFNLSITRYKRRQQKEMDYEPPKEILAKLLKLEDEIMQDLKSLNEFIK